MSIACDLIKSWSLTEGNVNSNDEILSWVNERNKTVSVDIRKVSMSSGSFWKYDEELGEINNANKSFFSIRGLKRYENDKLVCSQPVIIQNEIGYLGIICKKINGVLNFLMQAKIEPGNVNKIQISPTIQATKSNFTQKHGGARPAYLEYFINAESENIIVDQIQSEQSSRFYKKRNRNIIIMIDEDINVLPTHKWMTLGQLKKLMQYHNLVNMDTRTVISCIPYAMFALSGEEIDTVEAMFCDKALFKSIFLGENENLVPRIYRCINNMKMFDNSRTELVDLYSLESWHYENSEFVCKDKHDFKIVFCDISIEGREVKEWTQPLFEAVGMATFGLFTCVDENGVRKFLVHAKKENGCFDIAELGPTVQKEYSDSIQNDIQKLFFEMYKNKTGVLYDTVLSEEGGRFYHEQNYNIIIEIKMSDLKNLPEEYFWVDYKTLNILCQVNNCLNIQLRNLLSLLKI